MIETKFGYLRETEEDAIKAGKDANGICRTGLDVYLKVIFPGVDDWIHDKSINLEGKRYRPDYRSEKLKLIVEFDGLPHYQKPDTILSDIEHTDFYKKYGYKVVRIPYFIQLTNNVVKALFEKDVDIELFPEEIGSFSTMKNSPAYMCHLGVERCAKELLQFPEQLAANLNDLDKADDILSGKSLLLEAINRIKMQ